MHSKTVQRKEKQSRPKQTKAEQKKAKQIYSPPLQAATPTCWPPCEALKKCARKIKKPMTGRRQKADARKADEAVRGPGYPDCHSAQSEDPLLGRGV